MSLDSAVVSDLVEHGVLKSHLIGLNQRDIFYKPYYGQDDDFLSDCLWPSRYFATESSAVGARKAW
jgi:hypothetical protein